LLFLGDRGGEEVIGLVSRRLRISKPTGRNEVRQRVELLQKFGVEDAAALIGFERLMAVGRRVEGCPSRRARRAALPERRAATGKLAKPRMAPPPLLPPRRIDFGTP